MKKDLRKTKGITLIALVITIIVLLLLAGMSITMISSQDGILDKTTTAKDTQENMIEEEKLKLAVQSALIDGEGTIDLRKANEGEELVGLEKTLKEELGTGHKYNEGEITLNTGETFYVKSNGQIQKANNNATIEDFFKVANTYMNKVDSLTFGSSNTAYNSTCTNEIDCSSFLMLCLQGIDYEHSRYNNNDENIATHEYGIDFGENPYREGRWLANDIAHYAADNGFEVELNENIDNIRTGDIIFLKPVKSSTYYKSITHAAIVVQRLEGDRLLILHGNSSNKVGFKIINLFSEKTDAGTDNVFYNSTVMVARFNLNNIKNKPLQNLITNGEKQILNHYGKKTVAIKTLTLSENLKANTPYTLFLDMQLGNETYTDGFPAIVSDKYSEENKITPFTYSWVTNNKYYIYFFPKENITISKLIIYLMSKSNIANANRYGNFYGAKLYEGFIPQTKIE